jgi:hypothetical protein
MSKVTKASLLYRMNLLLRDNDQQEISAADVRSVITDMIDSLCSNSGEVNISGVLRYSAALSLSDDKDLVYLGYLNDYLEGFIKQGPNTLTEDTKILTDDKTFRLKSGLEGSAQYYTLIINESGITIGYIDTDDSSNNSAVTIAPGIVMINGKIQANGNPIYWKGDPTSPNSGDVREVFGVDPDSGQDALIVEKYDGADWAFSSSRII